MSEGRESLKHRRGVVSVQPGGCTHPVRDVYLLIGVASLEYYGGLVCGDTVFVHVCGLLRGIGAEASVESLVSVDTV